MSLASNHIFTRLNIPISKASTEGDGIQIAVLDGGIADIPAFEGRLERKLPDGEQDLSAPSQHATRCASLMASADPHAPGIAPKARLLSMNVSTGAAVDTNKLQRALEWLYRHPVDVISASFVMESPDSAVLTCTKALIDQGTCIVGAAANTTKRQQYAWVRQIPGAVRVFADKVPETALAQSAAHVIAAPGTSLRVVGADGEVVPNWRGQSSGATAIIAGLAARWLSDGMEQHDLHQRLLKQFR